MPSAILAAVAVYQKMPVAYSTTLFTYKILQKKRDMQTGVTLQNLIIKNNRLYSINKRIHIQSPVCINARCFQVAFLMFYQYEL